MQSTLFGRSVVIGFLKSNILDCYPHPYWMRLSIKGFSHGLKTCHRHVFLTAFRIPTLTKRKKKTAQPGSLLLLVGVSGFEPEASWTRTKRDTKLRHTPIAYDIIMKIERIVKSQGSFCVFLLHSPILVYMPISISVCFRVPTTFAAVHMAWIQPPVTVSDHRGVFCYTSSAISSTSFRVSSQPMQGSVMDFP